MENRYEIDSARPTVSRCGCCGALAVRVTGFVERAGARPFATAEGVARDGGPTETGARPFATASEFAGDGVARDGGPTETGDAFAVYFAAYENAHPEELAMLVSLGEWGDESDPSARAAFYCRVRPGTSPDANYEVMLGDAAASPWGDVEIVGEKLTQQEARRHPWKASAFEVLDAAFHQDPSLKSFLYRVRCGAATVPLEHSFQAPDVIFARRASSASGYGPDVELGRNWAILRGDDGDAHHFIRVLLPIPVEGYGDWRLGVWVAVTTADYAHIVEVWDDPVAYPKLTFTGRIANDFNASATGPLDLPVALGDEVLLHTPDADAPPFVKALASNSAPSPASRTDASRGAAVAALLAKTWPQEDFEAYAVAHRFL